MLASCPAPTNQHRGVKRNARKTLPLLVLALATVEVSAQQPAFQPPPEITFQADVEYARVGEHRLLLDLALPKQPKNNAVPLIIFIHGGGWMSGDKYHAWRAGNWRYAVTGDYATASINYRLSGVAPWPACMHDCKAAIRWCKANAAKYGWDGGRIAVWGHSAGGHLVAMLCTTAGIKELEGDVGGNLEFDSRVACGVDEAGPTDFPAYADYTRPPDSLISPRLPRSPEFRLFGGPLEEHTREMKEASATTYVDANDSPILIAHGSVDPIVPIDQAERLYEALKNAGAPVFYVRLNGLGHSVGHFEYRNRRDALFEKYLLGREVEITGGVFEGDAAPAPRSGSAPRSNTELGRLAATMKPGTWTELKTANYTTEVHGGGVFTRAESAVWSPRTQQLHFVGQGEGQPLRHITYSAAENAWKVMPVPSWWSADNPNHRAGHAYDNNAVDQNAGLIYHHRNGSGEVYYASTRTGEWRRLAALPPTGKPEEGTAMVYSPELNGLVRVYAGAMHVFRRSDRGWSILKDNIAMGSSGNVAEYNTARRIIVFGGGIGSAELHTLDAAGGLASLAKPPVPEVSINATLLTVDPVSGELLLDRASRKFYAHDFRSNRWSENDAQPPLAESSRNIIATPITNDGVVMFAQEDGPVLIYRHEGTAAR